MTPCLSLLTAGVLLALFASAAARPQRPDPSFVIAVSAQVAAGQPYARGPQSKMVALQLGSPGEPTYAQYNLTVDTGSFTLSVGCWTPWAAANCARSGKPTAMDAAFNLTRAGSGVAVPLTPSPSCACPLPGILPSTTQGICSFTQSLTGGQGFNGKDGLLARASIAAPNTLSPTPLYIPSGVIGCGVARWFCNETDTACLARKLACPANATATQEFLTGGCPPFASENGMVFSGQSLTSDAFAAGIIPRQVFGICYQRPQKDANCASPLVPNSAIVLGSAVPTAAGPPARLSVVPLVHLDPGPGSYLSPATLVTLPPVPGTRTPQRIRWDTGALGQQIVPLDAFQAFYRYFAVASKRILAAHPQIQPCANVAAVCGANTPPPGTLTPGINGASYACFEWRSRRPASAAQLAAIKSTLLSMYPPQLTITLLGGARASMPTAFALNLCSGATMASPNPGAPAAVCSYVRPPPPGSANGGSSNYFWVAGPWFHGRFTQFQINGTVPGVPNSVGVLRFSKPLSDCSFPGAQRLPAWPPRYPPRYGS